jgi:streptogramin lyase
MQTQVNRQLFYFALAVLPLVGCQCQCGGEVHVKSDGGVDAGKGTGGGTSGVGGGDAGATGGGSSTGGGAGTGGISLDAGDQSSTVGAGSFATDGGVGGLGNGVKLDPGGNLVLGGGTVDISFMWIANNDHGWVSKYDTRTGREIGRYWSVINRDCAGSAGPPCAGAQANGLSAAINYNPSRTAIDRHGDLWVTNRAIAKQGSVTKIANDVSGCIDRNGNGKIDTSNDFNADGKISTNPADHEMITPTDFSDPKQYDECVLFSTPVGGPAPAPDGVAGRALAVAAGTQANGPGDIWVGIYHEARAYKLDGNNGQITAVNANGDKSVQLAFGPYGAIVDRLQRLWLVEPGSARLAMIDTATGTVGAANIEPGANCSSYGIGIDGKNRVWVPGWGQDNGVACRYDHSTGTWKHFDFSSVLGPSGQHFSWGRGIAVDVNGAVYMSGYGDANSTKAQLIRFDAETGAVLPFGTAQFVEATDGTTAASIGVALDSDGNPWVNNYSGNVMKVDKTTGSVTRTAQQETGLYTYSDFTGYQLRNYTAPHGSWQRDFEGCADVNTWLTLNWVATVPANTQVQVYVRVADTQADLSNTAIAKYGPYTTGPIDLDAAGVPHKRFLRVFFELTSNDGLGSPTVKSLNLSWNCDGMIN